MRDGSTGMTDTLRYLILDESIVPTSYATTVPIKYSTSVFSGMVIALIELAASKTILSGGVRST